MTHPTIEKLAWHINWANTRMNQYMNDMTEEELFRQPSSIAPPIGWHIWHSMRFADLFQANFPNQEQVWVRDNLVEVCDLDVSKLGPMQLGVGISPEDATYICMMIGKQRLIDYAVSVAHASDIVVSNLTIESLGETGLKPLHIDFSSKPYKEIDKSSKSLIMDQICWYIGHSNRHLGMIEALIGVMFERDGTATV